MRLLVDTSSLIWFSLLRGTDEEFGRGVEHEGKTVYVNGWQFGVEQATDQLLHAMRESGATPENVIFVHAGKLSTARRKAIYGQYKQGRDSRPPQAYEQFAKCKEVLFKSFGDIGAQVVTQDGVEEDDILAYLARKLPGEMVILTVDGDMTTLINERVSLFQNGRITKDNKYGPFPCRYVPVYKALLGDGTEYKGAVGFGPKAFLNFLVRYGDSGLAALEGMMIRGTLNELTEDVENFKPFIKVVDGAKHVYESYQCALLHSEWVDTEMQPLVFQPGRRVGIDKVSDIRLEKWAGVIGTDEVLPCNWWDEIHPAKVQVQKNHAVFDVELIGDMTPVFLVCVEIIETGERFSFWWHKERDMTRLHSMLCRDDLTWVSFNGIHFDAPLFSAAIAGHDPVTLKRMAQVIIVEGGKSWEMPSQFDYEPVEFDHIDLIEPAPGVRTSLKTYAGRMGYPTMVDLPFEHDVDLTDEQLLVLESYCFNDIGVTKALFKKLETEIELRKEMSEEYGVDLRSKSDAQIAEAVLKKAASIGKRPPGSTPKSVTYKAPDFIETDSDVINDLIERLNRTEFTINAANGQVESPEWLKELVLIGDGSYQCGVGGLHSTHDKCLHVEATDEVLVSDFDVASYYPNIMLKAGLTPRVEGGARFIAEYEKIYHRRIEAKHSGNKKVADALKISLNGTFGKLGSPYSSFYSPDLMLAVTLTGQLNLLCLIYSLEFHPEVRVLSANTDGIMVQYPIRLREKLLKRVAANAERTGFEYEETQYKSVSMKDVNNYLAITTDGKVKRKGLYATTSLMKNPTNLVCSNMAVDYLKDGSHPSVSINKYRDIRDFVSIRVVKGGGIVYDAVEEVDDWVQVDEGQWRRQEWLDKGSTRASVKRKSRPKPVEVGVGGTKFGRIARWYMTTEPGLPINYATSGNKVPKTEGAKLCMTLPDELPADLDKTWYVNETISMLADMGVTV